MTRHESAESFRRDRMVLLFAALLLAVGALATIPSLASAQDTPETIDFRIVKVNCEEAPPDDAPPPSEQLPEGCEAAEGVDFTVFDTEGNEIASCTTDADGRCTVQAPNEADVVVEEDESTGEPGFSPIENPIETTAITEFAGANFINVRDEPKPTPELPDTGFGDGAMLLATGMAGMFAVIATVLALGGALVRRPGER